MNLPVFLNVLLLRPILLVYWLNYDDMIQCNNIAEKNITCKTAIGNF